MEFAVAHISSGTKLMNGKAWQDKLPELQQDSRWRRVFGSMSAAMATLLDAGFSNPSICNWIDPDGHEWQLAYEDPMIVPAIREVVLYFLQQNLVPGASPATWGEPRLQSRFASSQVQGQHAQEAAAVARAVLPPSYGSRGDGAAC